MPRRLLALLLLPVLALAAVAAVAALADEGGPGGEALRRAPRILRGAEHGVGRRVPDLAFTDLEGVAGRLSDYGDRDALVIAFTNVGCPICKKYAPRLARLPAAYAPERVALLLVNASPQDTAEAMRAAVRRYGFTARYVVDHDRTIARALGATTTAETFVLDRARTLVYRGALDDQHGVGWSRKAPRARYVEDAIAALLDGARPAVEATTAPGCVLRLAAPAEPTGAAEVTWHADVSRIVQDRCMRCHRAGQAAPFPLTRHRDLKGNAGMVRWAVAHRRMPPWFAGEGSLPMKNDPRLTDRERDTLLRWIDAGCPEGDPADAPVPRTWDDEWRFGPPDAVVEVPKTFTIPAEGVVPYRHVKVPTSFSGDRWVRAYEVRPSAPEHVHHVLVFVHYPDGHPHKQDEQEVRRGAAGFFAGLTPGRGAQAFRAGTAKRLPEGAVLEFQLHYTPNGTEARDRTRLALYFADGPPRHRLRTVGLFNRRFEIPPGAPNHRVTSEKRLTTPARLYAFMPHMHLRGKAFRYEALLPDGTRRMLLDVPVFDFNWQLTYELREPLDLPAGTVVRATGWFDNSTDNPANPDPTRAVGWGLQTWDEMMIGYVDWHPIPR